MLSSLPRLGQGEQFLAGVVRMGTGDDLAHFLVEDAGVEAVRALENEIAVAQELGREVRLAERLEAEVPGEFAPLRARHRLALEHETQLHRDRGSDVVGRQPLDRLSPDEVGPGVAHIGDADRAVAEDRGHERRRHRAAPCPLDRVVMHLGAGRGEHAPQERVGLGVRRRRLEFLKGALDGKAARDLAPLQAPDPVGQDGNASLLFAGQRVGRLPPVQPVLVHRPDVAGGREAGVTQAHGVKKAPSA